VIVRIRSHLRLPARLHLDDASALQELMHEIDVIGQ
jgi:hypothetical protein